MAMESWCWKNRKREKIFGSSGVVVTVGENKLHMNPHIEECAGEVTEMASFLHHIVEPRIKKNFDTSVTGMKIQRWLGEAIVACIVKIGGTIENNLIINE
jgi:hypothetical protein